jgi:L-alanine-DL-glutamate epimerase-like enolase superfamily enzyme
MLEKFSPLERQSIESILEQERVNPAVKAAIDVALWDWLGKKINLPLWQLWGLNLSQIEPISLTVGLNTPQGAIERVKNWQKMVEVKKLKIKLGSPQGLAADQEMLLAIRQAFPQIPVMVDANGGWKLKEALFMVSWLAEQGVIYVEQPLAVGQEADLAILSERSPLPIFVDESCLTSQDIPKLAPWVDGINIKLMKAGGLSEVIRMIHSARSCQLQVMFGCYSDSCLANTAMAHLSPLADHLDLDSHLNLVDDPFSGASYLAGKLVPNTLPGLGVTANAHPFSDSL